MHVFFYLKERNEIISITETQIQILPNTETQLLEESAWTIFACKQRLNASQYCHINLVMLHWLNIIVCIHLVK
jgi:hypothetical protein